MPAGADVRSKTGVPTAANFAGANGTPLVIDNTAASGGAYYLDVTGAVKHIMFFPQQATTVGAPAYVKGGMYYDTTRGKLMIGGAAAWEVVTSV